MRPLDVLTNSLNVLFIYLDYDVSEQMWHLCCNCERPAARLALWARIGDYLVKRQEGVSTRFQW